MLNQVNIGEENSLRYFSYTLPENEGLCSEIWVGNFPYDITQEVYNSIDGWISVTDKQTIFPTVVDQQWSPWNESLDPSPEHYYSVLRTLDAWIIHKKKKRIYLYCDGGTHRSVTMMGAYLRAYYPKLAESIVQARSHRGWDEFPDAANPLEYLQSYLESYPHDLILLKYIAHFKISHLDQLMKLVGELVLKRYGTQKRKATDLI